MAVSSFLSFRISRIILESLVLRLGKRIRKGMGMLTSGRKMLINNCDLLWWVEVGGVNASAFVVMLFYIMN